jgi:hypothetical protein
MLPVQTNTSRPHSGAFPGRSARNHPNVKILRSSQE